MATLRSILRILLLFGALGTAFLWGVVVGRYAIFPYNQIADLYYSVPYPPPGPPEIRPDALILDESAYTKEVRARLDRIAKAPLDVRERLKTRIVYSDARISPMASSAPTYADHIAPFQSLYPAPFEATRVSYYGLKMHSVLVKGAERPSGKLLIYCAGHLGNPFKIRHFDRLVALAHKNGYDVLALGMALHGFNAQHKISFPTRYGPAEFTDASLHEYFYLFSDPEHPELSGIGMLATGNYHLIKHAIDKGGYDDVVMTGISGGGWYTTVMSALIPEIDASAAFAPGAPVAMRGRSKDHLDYEYGMDPLFDEFDFWDFYALSTYDAAGRRTRTQTQAFISHHPCCSDGGTGKMIEKILNAAGGVAGFEIRIPLGRSHAMPLDMIEDILFRARRKSARGKASNTPDEMPI